MHNRKAVFFDLDGTVIDPATHHASKAHLDALKALADTGVMIFVATGRSYEALATLEGILDLPWAGFITSNGQRVFDGDGKELQGHYFSVGQVEDLLTFCREEQMTVSLNTREARLAPLGISETMVEAHTFFNEPLPEVIKTYHHEDVYMALIYNVRDYDFQRVERIAGLVALPNASTYADVVVAGVSKGSGMRLLCEKHGLALADTFAFGDSGNDLDMLALAGIGIAMGNASDAVKQVSDFVTKNVGEDGIGFALQHFDLIGS